MTKQGDFENLQVIKDYQAFIREEINTANGKVKILCDALLYIEQAAIMATCCGDDASVLVMAAQKIADAAAKALKEVEE